MSVWGAKVEAWEHDPRLTPSERARHRAADAIITKEMCVIPKNYWWATGELEHDPMIREFHHGSRSTYLTYGCRCPLCIAANREYKQARRASGLKD